MASLSLRTIGIGVAVLLVLGGLFWFREDISNSLSRKAPPEATSTPEIVSTPEVGTVPVAPTMREVSSKPTVTVPSAKPVVAPIPVVKKPTPAVSTPSATVRVAYSGRDPSEVNPLSDEVRLFSTEQREAMYQDIRTTASAVKTNPGHFLGWIHLGVLKKTIGDFVGARDAWEYAGTLQPKNSLSFANLGEVYKLYLKDYVKAEASFRTSITNKPDEANTYVSLAELYHYYVPLKYEMADDVLLEGLGKMPGNGTLMRRLAYLYEQRKEYASALQWWRTVAAAAPTDMEVKAKIQSLEARLSGN